MSLYKGKKNIGKNIEIEEAHGKPLDQAVAISLNVARGGAGNFKDKQKQKKPSNRYRMSEDGRMRT